MIGAIILAAGSSTRMGQSKQLLPVNGKPLLKKTVEAVLDGGISQAVVVLGSNESEHRRLLEKENIEIHFNVDWARGMGSSIRSGLRLLTERYPDIEGVIVLVCDQPLLNAEVIKHLIEQYRQTAKPVIASGYEGTAGVPVLFDRTYFESLMNMPDDQGAKKLIMKNPDDVAIISFPGGEIDLDTIDDYNTFLATGGSSESQFPDAP